MNPTRALGALLVVVGVSWFLAVPTVLPAAYHGHVHGGHEHAQYAARPVDPGVQATGSIIHASENAVVVDPKRDWMAVRADSLSDLERSAFEDATAGSANASEPPERDQYQRLVDNHPFIEGEDGRWFELALTTTENYTILTATPVETATVTRAVAVSPEEFASPTDSQARTLAGADGPVLVSSPALPTPLYFEHGDRLLRVVQVGDAPEPPSIPAFAMFLVPGAVLALLGVYLERTG